MRLRRTAFPTMRAAIANPRRGTPAPVFRALSQRMQDWTAGCIAVRDEEVEDISALVRDGTPILITPSARYDQGTKAGCAIRAELVWHTCSKGQIQIRAGSD